MTTKTPTPPYDFSSMILDYLEDRLTGTEREVFENELRSNAEFAQLLREYQEIVSLEEEVKKQVLDPGANFAPKIAREIEEQGFDDVYRAGFIWRFFMQMRSLLSISAKVVATCSVLIIVAIGGIRFMGQGVSQQFSSIGSAVSGQSVDQSQLKDGRFEATHENKVTDKAKGVNQSWMIPSNSSVEAYTGPWPAGQSVQDGAMPAEENNFVKKERQVAEIRLTDLMNSSRKQFPEPSSLPNHSAVSGTERYGQWIENKRVLVAHEPVSTFSIDVDTGSYTNARRFLQHGVLPPKDAVRVEEFINYFDYSYPLQSEKPFSLSYEIAPSPLEPERFLLKLGVKARDVATTDGVWNLTFLVDVSGSMLDENKLPLVKRSLKLLTERMRPDDKIAIVTYAGFAGAVLDMTSVREKQRILEAIESLGAGGSTYGSGGIHAAYDVAKRGFVSGAVNRVILATDGDFNVGTTSQDELIRLIEEKRKSGITLTTIGVGEGNFNESLMEQLANKGNGNYFYLDSFKEARKVFETQLAGTMEVVAKDVKLQIEFNPKHVVEYRLIGYENRKLRREDFDNDHIDAGEIGTGHTVTAIYEIVVTDSDLAKRLATQNRYQAAEPTPTVAAHEAFVNEIAFLKVRFKAPAGDSSQLLQFPIERAQIKKDLSVASNDFKFAAAVSYFAHLLRGNEFTGTYTFTDVVKLAESARGEDKLGYRQEFIELVKNAQASSR